MCIGCPVNVCQDIVPRIPLGASMGYGVAIMSYNQNLYIGMMAEPRVMPDVALMKTFVDQAFEELKRGGETRSAVPTTEHSHGERSA